MCSATHKRDSQWGPARQPRELSLVLCEDLDEWDGRDAKTEGTNADVPLIHFIVQQKLTQQCKATIPPIKKKASQIQRTGYK